MFQVSEIHRRKTILLIFGTILFFFTSMSKILVPGPIFNSLQMDLSMSAAAISLVAAFYMYSYAFSQFMLGIFSDRYGGARLLLIGGSCFAVGQLIFPELSSAWSMCAARALTAFGAGIVFLAVAKLVADLYPVRFAFVLGIVLMFGYLGPVTGVLPMTWLVKEFGWRTAMRIPAFCSAAVMLPIFFFLRGTIRRTLPGNAFQSIGHFLHSRDSWLLFLGCSLFFGTYYSLLTIAGQKCLQDFAHFTPLAASIWITLMALMVAGGNVVSSFILKLLGGRRKLFLLFSSGILILGSVLGFAAFQWNLGGAWVVASFLLITVPAGSFAVYGTIAKELNPGYVGLSISLLNFWAFVTIAIVGNIAGVIMHAYEKMAKRTADALVYPPEAYRSMFLFFSIIAVLNLCCMASLRETGQK